MDITEWAKGYFRAYESGDRAFIENNMTPDFTFTSPFDDAIGREAYFARCWAGHTNIAKFHFVAVAQDGDGVLVLYNAELKKIPILFMSARHSATPNISASRTAS